MSKEFSPYEEIKLDEKDLNALATLSAYSETFDKLHQITEYQLALKVAHWKISKEEFEWAMTYGKYLKLYLK